MIFIDIFDPKRHLNFGTKFVHILTDFSYISSLQVVKHSYPRLYLGMKAQANKHKYSCTHLVVPSSKYFNEKCTRQSHTKRNRCNPRILYGFDERKWMQFDYLIEVIKVFI